MRLNNKNQKNPEISREDRERRKSQTFYDRDDDDGILLAQGSFLGGTASSTESTGLIQVIPLTDDELEAYDQVYSYRQTRPIANKDSKKS